MKALKIIGQVLLGLGAIVGIVAVVFRYTSLLNEPYMSIKNYIAPPAPSDCDTEIGE